MYQHSVSTPHLPWSTPSPIQLLYQREAALSRKADEQAARFAGAFSIRSILSQTRSHVDSMASNQDHRYLSNVPCSFGPPEAVCCSEGSPLQGQTSQITTQLQEQEDSDVATYEPTKYQGRYSIITDISLPLIDLRVVGYYTHWKQLHYALHANL